MDKKSIFNLADMIDCMPKPDYKSDYKYDSKSDYKQNCVATALPSDTAVTMAYIPFQLDKTAYSPEKALEEGTLFPTLNKPFCGRSLLNG